MLIRFGASSSNPQLNAQLKKVKHHVNHRAANILDDMDKDYNNPKSPNYLSGKWPNKLEELERGVDEIVKTTPKSALGPIPVHDSRSSQYKDAHALDKVKTRGRDYQSLHNIHEELKTRNGFERRAKTGIEWDFVMVPTGYEDLLMPNYGIKIRDDGSHPPLSASAFLKKAMADKNAPLEQQNANHRFLAAGMPSDGILLVMHLQLPKNSVLIPNGKYITDQPYEPATTPAQQPRAAKVEDAKPSKGEAAETKADAQTTEPGQGSAKTRKRNQTRRARDKKIKEEARQAQAATLEASQEAPNKGKEKAANPFQVQ